MATQGGPAVPVTVQTGGIAQGGAAIPVAVVSDGRATQGGPAQPVVVVTSGPVQGGPAQPVVVAAAGTRVQGGPAMRVYVVSGSLGACVPANPITGRTLTFYDEFCTLSLDASKWNTFPQFNANGGGGANGGELQAYSSSALSFDGARLRITASHTSFLGLAYTSGLIDTYTHFSQVYGRFEAKVKISSVNAAWPAFWMLPITNAVDNYLPEIDVMEAFGQAPTAPFQTYHYDDGVPHAPSSTFTGPNFSADYHIFAIEWESDCISYFIDGILRFQEFAGLDATPTAYYMLLNMAVGGASGIPNAGDFPAYYDIEYVRAYAVETPPTGLPKISTISDDFNDGTTAAIWISVADLGSAIAETGGQLVCTPKSNAELQTLYTYYETASRYDLTGSSVFVQVLQAASNAAGPVQTRIMLADHLYKNQILMYVTAGQLRMRYSTLGTETNVSTIAYNSTTHAWWRIREASGTIYWDTAPDGATWTNRASVANPFAITALLCQVGILTYDNTGIPVPATSIFDNFNIPPPVVLIIDSDSQQIIDSDSETIEDAP